jgi:hypothetical protein
MPTRIFFSNGETVTVSDAPDQVAQALGGGGLAKLDRPWGDTSIYVNPSEILYIEAHDERAPDIAALEAVPSPASVTETPQSAPQAPGQPGAPGQFPAS